MNVKKCKCGLILNTDKIKKCVVCGQSAPQMTVVPSTIKNIKEAEFIELMDEMANEVNKHPEKYIW